MYVLSVVKEMIITCEMWKRKKGTWKIKLYIVKTNDIFPVIGAFYNILINSGKKLKWIEFSSQALI